MDTTQQYHVGKDYSNAPAKVFEKVEKYDEDFIDRTRIPRMPWHDEGVVVLGESARDLARHFISRWNVHKALRKASVVVLCTKNRQLIVRLIAINGQFFGDFQFEKCRNNTKYPYILPKAYEDGQELYINDWNHYLDLNPIQVNAQ
ncbi:unnamed protein product, partial [Didymodactylos carnosus]